MALYWAFFWRHKKTPFKPLWFTNWCFSREEFEGRVVFCTVQKPVWFKGDPLSLLISWVESKTMARYFLLLLLSFSLTHGQSTAADEDFDVGLIKTTHNPCPPTDDCIAQENCHHFQEDVAKLESLSIESLEYESLVADLKKGVCNKEEKGFCCSSIETNSVAGPRATKCCR